METKNTSRNLPWLAILIIVWNTFDIALHVYVELVEPLRVAGNVAAIAAAVIVLLGLARTYFTKRQQNLVYVWFLALGEYVWAFGDTSEIDRNDRRDLSLFRLGWNYLKRRLSLLDPIPDCLRPTFCLGVR